MITGTGTGEGGWGKEELEEKKLMTKEDECTQCNPNGHLSH